MRKKILFVGAINRQNPPTNGEEYKNQILQGYLERGMDVVSIDTMAWSKDPKILPSLMYHMMFPGYDSIVLSASSASVFKLLSFMKRFNGRMKKIIYFVIGGYYPTGISEGKYKADAYQKLRSIVVEGDKMKQQLISLGIRAPVHVVPNFKKIDGLWGELSKYEEPRLRFIFVSRITETKGVSLIFEALRDPRFQSLLDSFKIDFYGPIEKEYESTFKEGIQSSPNCSYCGYLDINNKRDECYGMMSAYHVMLFPTFWMGEGFPGAIIDALVCGIPVIASDWNMNSEVIKEGFTGKLIPNKDVNALADAMIDAISDRGKWHVMSANCHRQALEFDTDAVLNKHMEKII